MDNNHFFLGTASPEGFFSLFNELYNPVSGDRCYILKGGPGTGKSTFMRRIGGSAEHCGYNVEYINCASDPSSLDAVIIKGKNICIVDGTAPHIVEPSLPGVCEQIVDLGEYWDSKIIRKNRDEIIRINSEYRQCHENAIRFLKGASVLNEDTARIYDMYTDNKKISAFTDRISKRETERIKNCTGACKKRLISAITPCGIYFHSDTIKNMCDRIIGIEGNISVVSKLIACLSECMKKRGQNIILCPHYYNPEKEYMCLILPSSRICFIYANTMPSELIPDRIIHTSRFVDGDAVGAYKSRIRFNKRLSDELTEQAVNSLAKAKVLHDDLEKLYMPSMNFKKCEKRCDSVLHEILN